jgi:hypothetical protein
MRAIQRNLGQMEWRRTGMVTTQNIIQVHKARQYLTEELLMCSRRSLKIFTNPAGRVTEAA